MTGLVKIKTAKFYFAVFDLSSQPHLQVREVWHSPQYLYLTATGGHIGGMMSTVATCK